MLAKISGFMDFADCCQHLFADPAGVYVIVFCGAALFNGTRAAHLHILQIMRMWNIVFAMK